jgi:hypothetical protein
METVFPNHAGFCPELATTRRPAFGTNTLRKVTPNQGIGRYSLFGRCDRITFGYAGLF